MQIEKAFILETGKLLISLNFCIVSYLVRRLSGADTLDYLAKSPL